MKKLFCYQCGRVCAFLNNNSDEWVGPVICIDCAEGMEKEKNVKPLVGNFKTKGDV